jgi:2-keto-4-pentenoate hydratase
MVWGDTAHIDGASLPADQLLQPRVEAEIAFVMGEDLEGPITPARLLGAVAYALPAIEVVESAIRDWDIRFVDTVADNASSGHHVLGTTPRPIDGWDLRTAGMVMERAGEVVASGAGAACLGHPLAATLWLAKKMLEVGRPLRAGDLVLSGALGPLVPVRAGDVIEVRVQGLGSVRAAFERSRA